MQMVGIERHCLESPVIQPACYRRRRGRRWIWNVFLYHGSKKLRLMSGAPFRDFHPNAALNTCSPAGLLCPVLAMASTDVAYGNFPQISQLIPYIII
jgi:hypothetical protein